MNSHLTTDFVAKTMGARGYTVVIGPSAAVTGGAADSRAVQPGDLFAGFHGEHVDGNDYVAQALANGAVVGVCERAPSVIPPGKTLVVAPDTVRAMAELANAWLKECGTRVVGITGTVGKTTAKDVTAAVLSSHFRVHKSPGNFNSREGLPLAVMSLCREDEVSVLEMAMDSAGEILELCHIAEPTVGVVLNIGLTHVSKLGSIEAIAREKLSLVRYLPESGTAVINVDDRRIANAAPGLQCKVITFGARQLSGSQPTLAYDRVQSQGLNGIRFYVSPGTRRARVDSPLPGEHTLPSVMAALGVAMALGMPLFKAANAVRSGGSASRARTLPGANGSTIIDDRYNSSPASLAGALRLLSRLDGGGRRIALIGRMAELGDFEEAEHRRVGRLAIDSCEVLVAVGEPCRALVEEAQNAGHTDAHWFEDKDAAANFVAAALRPGDVVLLKASRSQAFETIIPTLEGAK